MRRVSIVLLIAALLMVSPNMAQAQAQSGVMYEVFVRSFADSDGDGIGDLSGLTEKLLYLLNLGVDGLWLMPVFPSPSYHGYDVTDYRAINPEYGTMDDFKALLSAAHAMGMRVLLDIPLNHTSIDHPWFSERPDWYVWSDKGVGDAWVQRDGLFYFAYFWEGMPDLNYENEAVRAEMIDIVRFWLEMGVDGFRLDATSHIFAQGEHGSRQDIARSAEWWRDFQAACKAIAPDCFLLGEAWEPLDERALLLTGLDAVVNFDVGEQVLRLVKSGGSGAVYVKNLEKIYASYAEANPAYVDAPFLTNHDQNRAFGMAGSKLERAKMAASMLLTLPGNPILYYGEEIGMLGAKPDEELRTPMLWGGNDPLQTNWFESRYNAKSAPVLQQAADPESLLSHYREMIALRTAHPALIHGTLAAADVGNEIVAAYTLTVPGETLLVIHNFTKEEQVTTEGTLAPYNSLIRAVE